MSVFENGGFIGFVNLPSNATAMGIWGLREHFNAKKDKKWVDDELYSFVSATFTNGDQTGRLGPSLTQARDGLSGLGVDDWKNNTEFFNTTNGIQLWTVPASGTYRIEALGAVGGRNLSYADSAGLGARMQGDFELEAGEIIRILVGQQGFSINNTCGSASGGGGTFVVREPYNTNEAILVIAGGGGGVGTTFGLRAGIGGTTSLSGTASNGNNVAGGSNGNGGAQPPGTPCALSWVSGSGGGFFTSGGGPAGVVGVTDTGGGFAFTTGGFGGRWTAGSTGVGQGGDGGFGGGGRGMYGAGGGGGYGGGGGGQGTACACEAWRGGGGGGSYNSGTEQSNSASFRNGHGQVAITKL